jgi:hypothetical protein
MKTESQNKIIREHLKKHKSISPLQALNKYGIYRLAARCHDLRNDTKDPLDIKTTMIYEHPVKFAKYHL